MKTVKKYAGDLWVPVAAVLFLATAACDGKSPTEPDPKPGPTFQQRMVVEACPPVDTLAMGRHIPCAHIGVEESTDGGETWEESFSYRNFRMHVRTPAGDEIRVGIRRIPNTNDGALASWDTSHFLVTDEAGTWSVRATADNIFGQPIPAAVERFEVVAE